MVLLAGTDRDEPGEYCRNADHGTSGISGGGEAITCEEIQEALTEQAQHRSASIPDLIVAATARARGLEILHYDRDFDTIVRFTDQPARWIVPPGTA